MTEIYIVCHTSGSYEDYNSVPVLATPDRAIADAFIKEMTDRFDRRNEVYAAINAHMAQWELTNPRPTHNPRLREKPLPSFPGPQKSWTAEQKALLKQTKADNEKKIRDANQPFADWAQARWKEQEAFTNTFSEQERTDLREMYSDSDWDLDSIPYRE